MLPLVLTFDWSPMTSFPRSLALIWLSSFLRNSRGARLLHGRREAPWAGEGWRKRVLRISLPTTRPCAPSVAAPGPRALPEAPAIGRAQEALARIDRMMDRNDP